MSLRSTATSCSLKYLGKRCAKSNKQLNNRIIRIRQNQYTSFIRVVHNTNEFTRYEKIIHSADFNFMYNHYSYYCPKSSEGGGNKIGKI